MRPACLLLVPLILAACDRPPAQRIALGEAEQAETAQSASPGTAGAAWRIAADGKGIEFGRVKEKPFLTLHCTLALKTPPQIAVIRHALSEPGAKALFAVIGNGVISRFNADARLAKEGWRWEAAYPAGAAEFEVFTGQRDIEATLPGAGTLKIAGSGLPREFIGWCRRNGEKLPSAGDTPSVPPPAP